MKWTKVLPWVVLVLILVILSRITSDYYDGVPPPPPPFSAWADNALTSMASPTILAPPSYQGSGAAAGSGASFPFGVGGLGSMGASSGPSPGLKTPPPLYILSYGAIPRPSGI